jgi:hypothetical protein
MTSLAHLVQMGQKGYVMNNEFDNLVTDVNIARLKGIPILFFSGTENFVYSPESTTISYSKLTSFFSDGKYDRVQFPGRGHLDCWMGATSDEDVYPVVLAHAEKVTFKASKGKAATDSTGAGLVEN